MFTKRSRNIAVAGFAAFALVGLSACSSDSDDSADSTTTATTATTSAAATTTESSDMDDDAELVGAGCAEYAEANPTGPASVDGMATEPVAVAASNNPMLSTLAAALSGEVNPDVDLVDTLNSGEFTVFAPVNSAFDKIDEATMDTLGTDADLLTKILTYHVVPGQISPADLDGDQTTVEGSDVKVTGSGDDLKINDSTVICGGIKTANATVYLLDTVMMPEAVEAD